MEWWAEFMRVRAKALHAMKAEGRTTEEMVTTLNLQDKYHAQRVLDGTQNTVGKDYAESPQNP